MSTKYEKLLQEKCRRKRELSMRIVYNAVIVKFFICFDVEQDDCKKLSSMKNERNNVTKLSIACGTGHSSSILLPT